MTNAELTNAELIQDPAKAMGMLGEGLAHFIRLSLAGYIEQCPETGARIAALLADPEETVEVRAVLRAGQLGITVSAHAKEFDEPRRIAAASIRAPIDATVMHMN